MPVNSSGEHFAQNGLQEGRSLHALEETLGYEFQDQSLLRQALTHPSCDGEVNYERLEFLGDAVIELVVSELLFNAYPKAQEGDLSQKRAAIVCTAGLADLAQTLSLGDYLVLGKAEVKSQGRRKLKILEDAMEAVLGAVYADSGYASARGVAIPLFQDRVATVGRGMRSDDYKSQFQELVQAQGKEKIEYVMTDQYGPSHEPTFEVSLTLAGRPLCAGTGPSKKKAEQQAAKYAVEHFRALYDTLESRPVESAHMQHKDAQELDSIMRLDDVDMFGGPDAWADPVQAVYDLTIDGDPVAPMDGTVEGLAPKDEGTAYAVVQFTLDGAQVPVAEVPAAIPEDEPRDAKGPGAAGDAAHVQLEMDVPESAGIDAGPFAAGAGSRAASEGQEASADAASAQEAQDMAAPADGSGSLAPAVSESRAVALTADEPKSVAPVPDATRAVVPVPEAPADEDPAAERDSASGNGQVPACGPPAPEEEPLADEDPAAKEDSASGSGQERASGSSAPEPDGAAASEQKDRPWIGCADEADLARLDGAEEEDLPAPEPEEEPPADLSRLDGAEEAQASTRETP